MSKQPRRPKVTPATTYGAILGKTIAAHRSEAPIDQAKLAAAVGVNQSTWSRIERGLSAITVEQLRAASIALNISAGRLLADAENGVLQARSRGIRLLALRDPNSINTGVALIDAAALKAIVRTARGKG